MNERELRRRLREAPLPGAEQAERRGLALVEAAFAERAAAGGTGGGGRRVALPRLALALAAATLLAALLLSPAGAAVRDWVDDVFTADVPRAEPGLARIPGGGRLLVGAADGPWLVHSDGSRRLLGDYGEATFSPRGLFVAVTSGRTLSALEPDGTPRWSIEASAPVAEPRWAPLGERIAYRSGRELHVVAGDGTLDHRIAAGVAAVPAAWSPLGLLRLAFVDGAGRLRIADSESGESVGAAPALAGIVDLEWGASGSVLLEASRATVRVRGIRLGKLGAPASLGPARELRLPAGASVRDAAIAPVSQTVAVLVEQGTGAAGRSSVLLLDARGGAPARLLSVPGRLSELAFSPGGARLLVAWPEADQWFFLPLGRGPGRAISDVSAAFSPGGGATAFPIVEGWCCRPYVGARG